MYHRSGRRNNELTARNREYSESIGMMYEIKGNKYAFPDYQEMTYLDYVNKTGTHLYNNDSEMLDGQQISLAVVGIDRYHEYLLVEPHIYINKSYHPLFSDKTRLEYITSNKRVYISLNDTVIDLREKYITDEITIWQWLDTTKHEHLGNLNHINSLFAYFHTYGYMKGIKRSVIEKTEAEYIVMRIAPLGDREPTISKRGKKPFIYHPDLTHMCFKYPKDYKNEKYVRIDMGESISGDYSYLPVRCLYDAVYGVGQLTNGIEWVALDNVYQTRKEAERVCRRLMEE
jgi:hypothetical protein